MGKYAVFKSYTIRVWICILGFFVVFVGLFYKAIQLSVKRGTIKPNPRLFVRSVLLVWSMSFEQTEEKRPKGIRLLMIMWVAFIVVIGTGYRSNLAANISLPEPEQKPKTFKELSEQKNYKINFDFSGVSAYVYFEQSNGTIFKNIHKRAKGLENTTDCVVESFKGLNTVCIGWDFTLKSAAAKNLTIAQLNDPLTLSTDSAWEAWYTFALPKNSIFTVAFQYIGQTLFETGLTGYWRANLLNSYRRNSLEWTDTQIDTPMYKKLEKLRRSSKTETKPLKVENVEFLFVILLAGFGLSLCSFFYELFSVRRPKRLSKYHGIPGYSNLRRIRRITVESKVIPIDFVP